jgi:hypothetical protein
VNDLREDLRRAGRSVAPPEDSYERLLLRRDRRRRNERLTAGILAMAVAIAGIGGALFALRSTGGERTRPGEGPPGLDLSMGPGQYSYVRRLVLYTGETTIETWWGLDGSGRTEVESTDEHWGAPKSGTFGSGEFPTDADLSDLSTDPAVLAGQVASRSAPGGASPQPDVTPGPGQDDQTGALWRAVTDLLDMPNASPELKAALFEVTAGITGVETVAGVRDPAGREAVLLQVDTESQHHELYVDPNSHQPLAEVDRSLDETWSISTIVLAAGIVDSTDEVPAPGDGLVPPPETEVTEPGGAR